MSQISIISFGFLHGEPPKNAHVVWDLRRHFRDPHIDPALRHLTARDPQVVAAVLDAPGIGLLIESMATSARAYMSGPSAHGNDLVYAVGCAGGRHRAATVAARLYDLLALDRYDVTLIHRDLEMAVVER